jgi:hypothetical protein
VPWLVPPVAVVPAVPPCVVLCASTGAASAMALTSKRGFIISGLLVI